MKTLSRRQFIRHASTGIAAAALAAPGSLPGSEERDDRPNILYVFADQMRFSAMGCMGNTCVRTPHLDRLARQGLPFENAFSCAPICTPYRAQLMTGRYAQTTGIWRNDLKLPREEVSLADVLKAQGYATGYIGKWHLNGGRKRPPGTPEKAGFVPPEDRQGWDYWAGLECSHNYFTTKYYGDTVDPIPVRGYEPDVQTDLAIEFIRQNKRRPFCLMLSFGPPHNPYKPPGKHDTYRPADVPLRANVPREMEVVARETIAQYYGLVTSLDENVGRLMKSLDDLQIGERTVVCFTSDHGDMLYSHGQRLKQKPWEESIHVPFIMRYPERVRPGRKSDVLLASVDIMPTLLGLARAPIPANVDGVDLSPFLLGESNEEPEAVFLSNDPLGRNSPWTQWRGLRTKEWKYVLGAEGDWLLYNLRQDPYEMNNLVSDPGAKAIRDKLHAMLESRRHELHDVSELKADESRKPG